MKVVSDLLVKTPVLYITDYITRARQLLREEGFRELYVTDEKGTLVGYIDITDVLRVTDTRSNVTVDGFLKDAPYVSSDAILEDAAVAIRDAGTDSSAVVGAKGEFIGSILLSELFPVLVNRHELQGLVGDVMTRRVVTCAPDDSIQKVYSLITESGYSAFPVEKDNAVVGIVSRKDFINTGRVRSSISNSANTSVEIVMTTPAIVAFKRDSLDDAAKAIVRHDISHLPVIENDGRIIGIINRQDLLNNLRI